MSKYSFYSRKSPMNKCFTGLVLRGKKLFEGDVIRFKYLDEIEEEGFGYVYGIITFENGCFVVKEPSFDNYSWEKFQNRPFPLYDWLFDNDCEYVGNIYDNSDFMNPVQPKKILEKVCYLYNETPDTVLKNTRSRERNLVEIRMITMFLMRDKFNFKCTEAARYFGKKHCAAVHAHKTICNLLETNRDFREKVTPLLNNEMS